MTPHTMSDEATKKLIEYATQLAGANDNVLDVAGKLLSLKERLLKLESEELELEAKKKLVNKEQVCFSKVYYPAYDPFIEYTFTQAYLEWNNAVLEELNLDSHKFHVLCGPPGYGKSAAGVCLCRNVSAMKRDGMMVGFYKWDVNTEFVSSHQAVLHLLTKTFCKPEMTSRFTLDEVLDAFSAKIILVVLDDVSYSTQLEVLTRGVRLVTQVKIVLAMTTIKYVNSGVSTGFQEYILRPFRGHVLESVLSTLNPTKNSFCNFLYRACGGVPGLLKLMQLKIGTNYVETSDVANTILYAVVRDTRFHVMWEPYVSKSRSASHRNSLGSQSVCKAVTLFAISQLNVSRDQTLHSGEYSDVTLNSFYNAGFIDFTDDADSPVVLPLIYSISLYFHHLLNYFHVLNDVFKHTFDVIEELALVSIGARLEAYRLKGVVQIPLLCLRPGATFVNINNVLVNIPANVTYRTLNYPLESLTNFKPSPGDILKCVVNQSGVDGLVALEGVANGKAMNVILLNQSKSLQPTSQVRDASVREVGDWLDKMEPIITLVQQWYGGASMVICDIFCEVRVSNTPTPLHVIVTSADSIKQSLGSVLANRYIVENRESQKRLRLEERGAQY